MASFESRTVTSVRNDLYHAFGSETTVDSALYRINTDSGILTFDFYLPYPGPDTVQVVYTAGMAADTTAFVAASSHDFVLVPITSVIR